MQLRSINTYIWSDEYIEQLTTDGKLLFVYLLTNRFTTTAGIYKITLRVMCFETGMQQDTVSSLLQKFAADDKVYFVDGYIVMKNYLDNQNYSIKGTVAINVRSIITSLPVKLKAMLVKVNYSRLDEFFPDGIPGLDLYQEDQPTDKQADENKDKDKEEQAPAQQQTDEQAIEQFGQKRISVKDKDKIDYAFNVRLTEQEYLNLEMKYGPDAMEWMIEKLSAYKKSSGKTYKSDEGALRSWVVGEWLEHSAGSRTLRKLEPEKMRASRSNELENAVSKLAHIKET